MRILMRFGLPSTRRQYITNIDVISVFTMKSNRHFILVIILVDCAGNEFMCYNGYGCIDDELVCDSVPVCYDKSDEDDCRKYYHNSDNDNSININNSTCTTTSTTSSNSDNSCDDDSAAVAVTTIRTSPSPPSSLTLPLFSSPPTFKQ